MITRFFLTIVLLGVIGGLFGISTLFGQESPFGDFPDPTEETAPVVPAPVVPAADPVDDLFSPAAEPAQMPQDNLLQEKEPEKVISAPRSSGLSLDAIPESHDPISPAEKFDLLDKAEATLAADKEISPMEMIKAAYVLTQHGSERQTIPYAKTLLRRFNELELTERELFDIADRLGAAPLAAILAQPGLNPEGGIAVDLILGGYEKYLAKKDPTEKVLLWKELKTPLDLINAATGLSKGKRPEVAGTLLKRFLDLEATPEQLAEINDKIGAAELLMLSTQKELQPQGRIVAMRILEGTREFREKQGRPDVRKELQRIQSGSQPEIVQGITALWKNAETSIEELVDILGSTDDPKELAELDALFRSMRSESKGALAVVLESGKPKLVLRAANILYSYIPREEAVLFYPALFDERLDETTRTTVAGFVKKLQGKVPDRNEAAFRLHRIAIEFSERNRPLRVDSDGNTTLWDFNHETGKPQMFRLPAVEGYRKIVSRFAEQAFRIAPDNREIRALHYAARMNILVRENGLDEPTDLESSGIQEIAKSLSVDELEDILAEAIKRNKTAAGIASATLMGTVGTAETVLYTAQGDRTGRPRVLVQATACGNPRIRFAAVAAIMRLNPDRAYPGSSLVSDALVWFARGEGKRIAVIRCPKISEAMKLSGFLIPLGYETKVVTTNSEAMQEAIKTPDVELVIVDARCSQPIVPVFAQEMRTDPRTREIPIAIISADPEILQATPITKAYSLTSTFERSISNSTFENTLAMIFPYPQDEEQTATVVGDLLKMTSAQPIVPTARTEHAKDALRWLTQLTRDYSKIYRIENREESALLAACSPVLTREGMDWVAQIGSNQMQQLLVEIASDRSVPEEIRQKAASAFGVSVEKNGVKIRGRQVQRVFDQYDSDRENPAVESLVQTLENRESSR